MFAFARTGNSLLVLTYFRLHVTSSALPDLNSFDLWYFNAALLFWHTSAHPNEICEQMRTFSYILNVNNLEILCMLQSPSLFQKLPQTLGPECRCVTNLQLCTYPVKRNKNQVTSYFYLLDLFHFWLITLRCFSLFHFFYFNLKKNIIFLQFQHIVRLFHFHLISVYFIY